MKSYKKKRSIDLNIKPEILIAFGIFAAIIVLLLASDIGIGVGGCVATINIDGEISMQRVDGGLLSSAIPNAEDIANTIDEVAKKDSTKAILIKINSPGGSVVGSRLIRNALRRADVPTVAYLGEVAASGGYYIASGADYIVSDPNTITGSIGVIAVFTDARDLLEKVGVNITAVTSGKHKSMGSFFSGLDNESRAIVSSIINETYEEFVNVVEEGRGTRLNKKAFLAIADGRILSGRQANAIGMVDELGEPRDALNKARELAGDKNLPSCNVKVKPSSENGLSSMKLFNDVLSKISGGIALR
ncbi:MAG: signal peptide peptidase SppA [Methanobacteriota archaeon]|nr:MAG: signal peptide peptidase SppA [Euryarchaeota archaeon]